jgi:hypothetical protein
MALGPEVTSKTEFRQYIREMLGYPVIDIEITDTQLDHCIREALELFRDHAYDGLSLRFQELSLTAGTSAYTLAHNVDSIYALYDTQTISLDGVFPKKLVANFYGNSVNQADLLSLHITRDYLSTLDFMLKIKIPFDYNATTKQLYLLKTLTADQTVGIVYYEIGDWSDENSLIFDHHWVKKFSVARSKLLWGNSLSKFGTGSFLPQGLQLNSERIISEAEQEVQTLMEELYMNHSAPLDFFTG